MGQGIKQLFQKTISKPLGRQSLISGFGSLKWGVLQSFEIFIHGVVLSHCKMMTDKVELTFVSSRS